MMVLSLSQGVWNPGAGDIQKQVLSISAVMVVDQGPEEALRPGFSDVTDKLLENTLKPRTGEALWESGEDAQDVQVLWSSRRVQEKPKHVSDGSWMVPVPVQRWVGGV